MVLNTKVSGISSPMKDLGKGTKSGAMVAFMKVTGRWTRLMAREDLSMLMVTSMTDTGKMIKCTDLVKYGNWHYAEYTNAKGIQARIQPET